MNQYIIFKNNFLEIKLFLDKGNDFEIIKRRFESELKIIINKLEADYTKISNLIRSHFLLNSYGYLILIKGNNNIVFSITDIISSIKLFYKGNKIINQNSLDFDNFQLDIESLKEINSSGYTHGENTLYKNIKVQESDSIYLWINEKLKQKFIFKFRDHFLDSNKSWFTGIGETVKEKLISLKKKGVLISLSGGLDSRIILMSCIKSKINNIICFSYGPKNNPDALIASKICNKLNIKWIDCTNIETKKYNYKSFLETIKIVNSVPMDEAFEALDHLKLKYAKDYLLINGQTRDFITGGHLINKQSFKNKIEVNNYIKNKYFKMNKYKNFHKLEKILSRNQKNKYLLEVEDFEWKNRQSKYVTGVLDSYEYFGFDAYLPLWHGSFINFWRNCSVKDLKNQNLYEKKIKIFSKKFDLEKIENMQNLYNGNIFIIKCLGKILSFRIKIISQILYIILLLNSKYKHRLKKHSLKILLKSICIFDYNLPFGRFCLLLTILEINNKLGKAIK